MLAVLATSWSLPNVLFLLWEVFTHLLGSFNYASCIPICGCILQPLITGMVTSVTPLNGSCPNGVLLGLYSCNLVVMLVSFLLTCHSRLMLTCAVSASFANKILCIGPHFTLHTPTQMYQLLTLCHNVLLIRESVRIHHFQI